MEKRIVTTEKAKGLSVSDLILVAVLLAAGAVLKYFVGSIINIGGMKPNFIIAMYCLAIVLIRPRLPEAAVIGVLAGVICQLFPGTPYLNLISETAGAVVMSLLVRLPLKAGKFRLTAMVSTFLSTIISGGLYTVCLFLFTHAEISAMAAYVPIVLCTAAFNTILVQALYIPLQTVLHK